MGLTLYYAPMTSATRIYWALEELGVPFEKVKLDLQAGDQRKPEYLKLNPNGKVPLLVVDGQPMFESLAQLLWLGETYGVDKGLFPKSGQERMVAVQWMAWGSVTFYEVLSRIMYNTADRYPADERNGKAAESARQKVGELLRILDAHLDGKQYLLGDSFSLADCGLVNMASFSGRLGVDLSSCPNVNAWIARCLARPAFGRALKG
jgi:glutathione S-transferase